MPGLRQAALSHGGSTSGSKTRPRSATRSAATSRNEPGSMVARSPFQASPARSMSRALEAERVRAARAVDDARVRRPVVGGLIPPGMRAVVAAVRRGAGAAQRAVGRRTRPSCPPSRRGGSRAAPRSAGGSSASPGSTSRARRRSRASRARRGRAARARPAPERAQRHVAAARPHGHLVVVARRVALEHHARQRAVDQRAQPRIARARARPASTGSCARRGGAPSDERPHDARREPRAEQGGDGDQEQRDEPPEGRGLDGCLSSLHGHGR